MSTILSNLLVSSKPKEMKKLIKANVAIIFGCCPKIMYSAVQLLPFDLSTFGTKTSKDNKVTIFEAIFS